MTSFLFKLWNRFSPKRAPLSVMIIGLDDSGKTSILDVLTSSSTTPSKSSTSKEQRQTASTPHNKSISDDDNDIDLGQLSDRVQGITLTSTVTDSSCGIKGKVSPTIGYNYERIQYKGQTVNVLDFSGQSKYRGLWQEFFTCVDGIVFVIDSSDLIRLVVVRDELETLLSHPYFATIAPSVLSFTVPQDHVSSMETENDEGVLSQRKAPVTLVSHQFAQKQVIISQGKLIQSPLTDWADVHPSVANNSGSSTVSNTVKDRQGSTVSDQGRRLRTKIPILFLANKTDLNNSADSQAIAEALNLNQVPKQRHPWLIQATSVRTNQGIFDGFDWLFHEIVTID